MLGVAFGVAATNLPFAISLILVYAFGYISVIVLAGTFTEVMQRYLNWDEKTKAAVMAKKICGALVLLAGITMAVK